MKATMANVCLDDYNPNTSGCLKAILIHAST